MRLYSLAVLCASASLFAIPAVAQTSTQPNGSAAANHNEATQAGTNPRQELMTDLQKAGFTKIRIEPEAFIVHAVNSQGEPVLMQIGPDSMESVTALKMGHSSASASNGNGSSGSHAGTQTE